MIYKIALVGLTSITWIMEGVWYDFPMTLERNVMIFHKKMFGRESYRPSGMVKKYSKQIEEKIKGR